MLYNNDDFDYQPSPEELAPGANSARQSDPEADHALQQRLSEHFSKTPNEGRSHSRGALQNRLLRPLLRPSRQRR